MNTKKITIGLGITGSYCTFGKILNTIKELITLDYNIIPIISDSVKNTSTRFYDCDQWIADIEKITGNKCLDTIVKAEPIGPTAMLDLMIILPCTGNTLAKLANGITDSPVTMAAKAHLRNQKPLVIGISTNDGLSGSFNNLAAMYNKKHCYIVPLHQDDPIKKPNSLVAVMDKVIPTIELALKGQQIQPLLLGAK